jgi:uncharacterized caspase-like protein
VALVIGNSNYSNAGVLPNPVNDARAIAATLSRLGFAVTDYYDVTREKMGRALKDFGDRAEGAEWAVVFLQAMAWRSMAPPISSQSMPS